MARLEDRADNDERNQYIAMKKTDICVEEFCHGLHEEFVTYITYVRGLDFDEQPDYSYLRRLLRNLYLRQDLSTTMCLIGLSRSLFSCKIELDKLP